MNAKKPRFVVSFSGGRTSGMMAKLVKDKYGDTHDLKFLFMNTSKECDETLDFVDRCDKEFGLDVVWLEAVIHHQAGVATTFKITNYEYAKRDGEIFEDMIRKYGIANKSYPHCTRELKLQPCNTYLDSIGWGDVVRMIGMRSDEKKRVKPHPLKKYPLDEMNIDKIDVNNFWEDQSFNLGIEDYRGNCDFCWKKSIRKLIRIMDETPEVFDFPERMEKIHGLSGHNKDGKKRVFFREVRSTLDIKRMHKEIGHNPLFANLDDDDDSGCTESCEGMQ